MTAEASAAGPAQPPWLTRASRKQLVLWPLLPWLAIFLLGHQILVGCRMMTFEGLAIHATFAVIGPGATLGGLARETVGPASTALLVVPFACLCLAELLLLRTRKLIYLLVVELILGSHFVLGLMFMLAMMSV